MLEEIIKDNKKYWTDKKRDNKWSQEIYTKEQAEEAAKTLSGCHHCTDCYDCIGCDNCVKCTQCAFCDRCTKCNSCSSCKYCFGCSNCFGCEQCYDCVQCNYSKYLKQEYKMNNEEFGV